MKLISLLHGLSLLAIARCQTGGCPPPELPEEQRAKLCESGKSAVNASTLDKQPACCSRIMPPIKLLETGTSVVDVRSSTIQSQLQTATCASGGMPYANCINPPAYYTHYTNVYTTNYREGIPILANANVTLMSFGTVRTYVNKMLQWTSRIFPEVPQILSRAYVRVAIRACSEKDWSQHPEGYSPLSEPIEIGGASRDGPTIGAEEETIPSQCFYHSRYPGALEEVFHTIHAIVIRELDKDAYIAILCLAARDGAAGIFSASEKRPPAFYTQTPEQRLKMLSEAFGDDFESTVSYEYFVSALAVWMGLPLGDFYTTPNVASRAAIKANLTDLACLLARYVPDVGETDGRYCAVKGNTSLGQCNKYPGSCYCGPMTDAYLGPPLDKQQCPSVQAIKENSGYKNRNLPGNGARFTCSGCVTALCGEDKGLRARLMSDIVPSTGSTIQESEHFIMFLALAVVCLYA